MATQWVVKTVEHTVCAHSLDVVSLEVEYEVSGSKRITVLDYHLVDLLAMPGDLRENLRHLIDVNVAHRLSLRDSQEQLSALEGTTGSVADPEALLQEHAGGVGTDHPPFHEYIDPVVQQ